MPAGNVNWPQLNDPKINAAMEKAGAADRGHDAQQGVGQIDNDDHRRRPAIPWLWDKTALSQSKNVHGVMNSYTTTLGPAYTSLK